MRVVRSELERMVAVREISSLPLPFRLDIKTDDRSMGQNALSHVWYGEIARQGRELSTVQARRFCKLHFGVPILRAGEQTFRDAWDRMIKTRLSYAEKLELMDWWPVTSLMDRDQMREYLTAMAEHFRERGIILTGNDYGLSEMPEARRA